VTETPPTSTPDPGARFLGWILVAMGGLVALLCGLCTLVTAGIGVLTPSGWMLALYALILGGLPTAGGVALVMVGRRLIRGPRPKPDPNVFR